ncbi:MAG: glycyl-radical enzyme activating protein, partial [Planctomycetota bacterium]
GQDLTVEEVMSEVLADRAFYERSGGGMTLSGGEPLTQPELACEILRACKAEGIHAAVETNLAGPWDRVASLLHVADLVMMDVKTMDPDEHRRWTGADNRQVLANARRLSAGEVPVIVRTPMIAGLNATAGHVEAVAAFIADWPHLLYYELLPYHPLGAGKYESLGMDPPGGDLDRPDEQTLRRLADAAGRAGVEVRVAGIRSAKGQS